MAILTVRDNEGNEIPIPSIRGKSAYEYALDGGYTGTEEEFAQELGELNKNFANLGISETESGTATTNSSGIGIVSFVNTHSYAPKAVIITNLDTNSRLIMERKVTKTGFECVSFMVNQNPAISGNINFNWLAIW